MAYTNKTKNYELPQWTPENKPERKDFNEAFAVLDEELANRLTVDKNMIWYRAELLNDFTVGSNTDGIPPVYMKDSSGNVTFMGSLSRTPKPEPGEIIARLPEGFRPSRTTPLFIIQPQGGSTWGYIDTSGIFRFQYGAIPTNYLSGNSAVFNVTFKAK